MLPPLRNCPVLVCLALLLAPIAAPQQTPSRPPPAPADQEQIIAYWSTETGWKSELQLRNNQAVQDQPDEQMWIDVGKLHREHVPDKNGKALPADLRERTHGPNKNPTGGTR